MKKKIAALLVTVSLLLTMFALPVAANPTDVSLEMVEDMPFDEEHWSYEPMANLVAMGVVRGYPAETDPDGLRWVKILPDRNITRAEFSVMLVQALNLKPDNTATPAVFPDVPAGDASVRWFKEAVDILSARGVIGGYEDGTFRPKNKITRAEIATMLVKSLNNKGTETSKTFSDVETGRWYAGFVLRAAHLGIINGYSDGSFKPNKNATRAEVMTMIYQFMWNDDTRPADDKTLLEVTDAYIEKQLAALAARPFDFSGMKPYTTGEKEFNLVSEEEAFNFFGDALSINYEKLSAGTVDLKSDRLAQVSYQAKLTMKYIDPDTKEEVVAYDNVEFTDYYLLMKIGDKWLIYSNFDEGITE